MSAFGFVWNRVTEIADTLRIAQLPTTAFVDYTLSRHIDLPATLATVSRAIRKIRGEAS